jgi:hypothetical protein
MVEAGFLRQPYRDMLLIDDDLERLLQRCAAYQPPDYTWSDDAAG